MKSFPVLRNLTSITLAACCAIGASSAFAQTYTLTDLGVLPGQKPNVSTPAAITNRTKDGDVQVAGTSGTAAFRYTSGKEQMEDVGQNSAGNASRGFGINGSGVVVGDSTFDGKTGSHAALFSHGVATNLGTLEKGGPFSRANGINASGRVVGSSSQTLDGNESRAFVVSTPTQFGFMTDLGTLGGAYAQALGINDSGFVTGNSQTGDAAESIHAFIWHPKKRGMYDLGTLDGGFSYGTSINAKNHVAGYSTINNFDDRVHAFLHNGEKMIDLGSLAGAASGLDYSYALGVNAADQVVGYSYLSSDQGKGLTNTPLGPWSVAFVYSQGLMKNLNDLIGDAAANYRLDSATGINDAGQIVAIAFNISADSFHAVLLTPNTVGDPIESFGSAKR
jgi:probable HAF family extracellular repeat protein